jgi:hypothetical protein
MKVRLKLKPGQRGTKHLSRQYGDRLVCVRYRYDEEIQKRYTTVELIVDEEHWQPDAIKNDTLGWQSRKGVIKWLCGIRYCSSQNIRKKRIFSSHST